MTAATEIHTDAELLSAYARARDAGAFAELVRRYAGMVYATALRITRNPADAEDVSQECFLTLARTAKPPQTLAGWLHALASSRAIDASRRSQTRRRYEQQARPSQDESGLAAWERLQPSIDAAIGELPEDLRDLVTKHYLCGIPQSELSRQSGLSQPTVSRRLNDAVGRLRERLEDNGVVMSVATVADGLAEVPLPALPTSLQASLGKLAIAGLGSSGPATAAAGASVGSEAILLAVAALIALAGAWLGWLGRPGQKPALPTTVTQVPPAGATMNASSPQRVDLPHTFSFRVIELPAVRMVRSGNGDLSAFNRWWSAIANADRSSLSPRDFMWSPQPQGRLEWVYAPPAGVSDIGGYATFDFPGGLYIVAAAREEDMGQAYAAAVGWIERSGVLELDERAERWSMGHVITPQPVNRVLGYNQMDLFMPVRLRPGATREGLPPSDPGLRVLSIPASRTARPSGNEQLFLQWVADQAGGKQPELRSRLVRARNGDSGAEDWVYFAPEGVDVPVAFQADPFPGATFLAVTTAADAVEQARQYANDFLSTNGLFAPNPDVHIELRYTITPPAVAEAAGASQVDLLIPITYPGESGSLTVPDRPRKTWVEGFAAPNGLRGLLQAMGEASGFKGTGTYTETEIFPLMMGICGDAFRFAWYPANGADRLTAEDPYVLSTPQQRYTPALQAAGLEAAIVFDPKLVGDSAGGNWEKNTVRNAVVESLRDRGWPVLLIDLPEPGWNAVITGYANGGERLYGWAEPGWESFGMQFEPAKKRAFDHWFTGARGAVIPTVKHDRPPEATVLRGALGRAVGELTRRSVEEIHTGPATYEILAERLADPLLTNADDDSNKRRAAILFPMIWDLATARHHAVGFLRRSAEIFPEASEEFGRAADEFQAIHDAVWQIQRLGGGGDPGSPLPLLADPAVREQVAAIVLQCRDHDLAAAEAIRAGLGKAKGM